MLVPAVPLDHVPLFESSATAPQASTSTSKEQALDIAGTMSALAEKAKPVKPAKPFVLARSLAPILAKLVSKFQGYLGCTALPFVVMRELLLDSIVLVDHLDVLPGVTGVAAYGKDSPKQREVLSLLTWVPHVAIVHKKRQDQVKDLLAYLRLIVREAQHHYQQGWMNCGYVFHSIAATDEKTEWAELDPSLLASFVMGAQPNVLIGHALIAIRWTTVRLNVRWHQSSRGDGPLTVCPLVGCHPSHSPPNAAASVTSYSDASVPPNLGPEASQDLHFLEQRKVYAARIMSV